MDTMELIKLAHEGDSEARELLVTNNLGLIWSIVRRFYGRGHEMDDLFQIGSIGLLKAIDKFDCSYDVQFSTYAVPMIAGEIKRFLRDDGMIKISRGLKQTAYKTQKEAENMINELGREPTIYELSKRMDMDASEIALALEANGEIESLNKTIYQNDGNEILLMDKIKDESSKNNELLDNMVLEGLLNELSEQEKNIIMLRYFMDKTQTQIAKEIGISQVQVSRLEKRILKQMRDKL